MNNTAADLMRRNLLDVFNEPDPERRSDLGHLGFRYGPAGQPPVATGMDIAHGKDGVIVELYTFVTEVRRPS
ncbi:hypothetical protein [Streptomyces milbemycinicus]|uniref:Uncharacterized protein n=1 Tax=Streptomyces milbemycinicus TaxID=476552 RepID=A0ABW8M2N9_9ACTN